MLGRPLAEIRYIVVFVPVEAGEQVPAGTWFDEGLSISEIDRICKSTPARASLFQMEDVARVKRLAIIPHGGIGPGEVYQLQWAEQERFKRESRDTGWAQLLRDEFG